MLEELKNCKICPHKCSIDRLNNQVGRCKCTDKIEIALASLHYFEEPCISGQAGSGTIFFSHCNLNCMYCQNYNISQEGRGRTVSSEELAEIMIQQQGKGANNINLVTPTTYTYQIRQAIILARKKGLLLPIIYNTNGYETVKTLQDLEGYIDVYLPDFKYYTDELSKKYSKVDHYFEIVTKAIKEMQRQVGNPIFDEQGLIKKGVIIRHLVLPNHIQNTKHILKWIKENLMGETYVSVMAQYFPTYLAKQDPFINRKLTQKEYDEVEKYLYSLELENGYIQELGKHEEEYVPTWDINE